MTTKTFLAEFLDYETDEVVETVAVQAETLEEAREKAMDEAEYQGYDLGDVRLLHPLN